LRNEAPFANLMPSHIGRCQAEKPLIPLSVFASRSERSRFANKKSIKTPRPIIDFG
jgi:hypothetical protein